MGIDILPVDEAISRPHQEASGFEIADVLRMLRLRWKLILAVAAIVVVLTGIVVYNQTPLYNASSLVMLDQRKNNVVDVNAVLSGLPTDPASLENQIQILRSRTLAGRVADKLHLDRDPEFNPAIAPSRTNIFDWIDPVRWVAALRQLNPSKLLGGGNVSTASDAQQVQAQRDVVINNLLATFTAVAQGRSTAILITVTMDSPSQSAILANAVADAYVEDQLNAKFDATQKTSQWLADRLQELAAQARAADAAVAQYKADYNITDVGNNSSLVQTQVGELSGQLITARSDLAEKEAKLSRISELEKSGRSSDVTSVVDSPVISQLRTQENDLLRQEADFATRYGPRHPKMIELESSLKTLHQKISDEVDRLIKNSDNDVAISRARVKSLQDSLGQFEGRSTNENQARVKLTGLQANATSAHTLYDALLTKFNQTQGQDDIQTPDARIISRAQIPIVASSPRKGRDLEVALGLGLILGFALALLIERLDAGFRTASQVEGVLGLPVLASVPEITGLAKTKKSVVDRVVDKPMSAFSEAIRGLQMGLMLSNVDKKPKVVLVTSSIPGEGKTTVAIALARIAARNGQRVVIVDGDLRRPAVAKTLGLTNSKNSLVDVLSGDARVADIVIKDSRSDAMILTTREVSANAPDLLNSLAMEKLILTLRESCDLVVIDSAPLIPVNDTKVLARLADTVVFAARWERTPRAAIQRAIRALTDVNATIAGIVLTRADAKRFQYYSYGYQTYYTYKKYYSD